MRGAAAPMPAVRNAPTLPTVDVRYVHVRGSIGAGKSTLVERMRTELEARVRTHAAGRYAVRVVAVLEPVDAFTDVRSARADDDEYSAAVDPADASLLARIGSSERRASGALFQMFALVARVTAVERAIDAAVAAHRRSPAAAERLVVYALCERSLDDDANIFAEALYENGVIDATERCAYRTVYDFWARRLYPGRLVLVVYWRATARVCAERARARARTEDEALPRAYLEQLERAHDTAILGAHGAAAWRSRLDGERALRLTRAPVPTLVFCADRLGDTRADDRLVAWLARACAAELHDSKRERAALGDVRECEE